MFTRRDNRTETTKWISFKQKSKAIRTRSLGLGFLCLNPDGTRINQIQYPKFSNLSPSSSYKSQFLGQNCGGNRKKKVYTVIYREGQNRKREKLWRKMKKLMEADITRRENFGKFGFDFSVFIFPKTYLKGEKSVIF